MPYMLAVDIGGTFTDLVAYDLTSKRLTYSKSLTTYEDLGLGVFDCIRKSAIDMRDALFVKHGTTLVINALLQRNGAKTALLTTRGFRDVLEIGRGNRTHPFDLRFRRDPPLIGRDLRLEVSERVTASGEVREALDTSELESLATTLRDHGVQALAISFLNSYVNPEHEQRAAEHLRRRLPDLYISCGSALSREWFEYERTATAAANAYVGPQLSTYLDKFQDDLRKAGFTGSLLLMGSHGGVLSVERVHREPIALVESGPVGGCIGTAALAKSLDLHNVIAFDMGGTTAKCALIERGEFSVESMYYVGGFDTGFPVRGNVIDIIEVGAGGGSVAWIDDQRRMHVGPRSAGSTPGPVCYGKGGREPTVTDANLVLGRINRDSFLGGEMMLFDQPAREAIETQLARPLGYDDRDGAMRAAHGVLTLANLTMTEAIKKTSVAKGLDPRDFALFCYGGGGPLHGTDLARELHIPLVIVPPEPGNFSALGMLMADARLENVRTFLADFDEAAASQAQAMFAEMETSSRADLEKEFGVTAIGFTRKVELRYKGQKHSLRVDVDVIDLAVLRPAFDDAYRRRYGHARPNAPVEFVGLQTTATLEMQRPGEAGLGVDKRAAKAGAPASRPVYFMEAESELPATIYDRYTLPVGFCGAGPAVIEEYGSTTIIGPNDTFAIGALGEIRIDCSK
jgi:N-methylhydantoinase A